MDLNELLILVEQLQINNKLLCIIAEIGLHEGVNFTKDHYDDLVEELKKLSKKIDS